MTDRGMVVPKIVGLIFGPVGIVLLAIAGYTGHRLYTILKSWPTVEAEVSKSELVSGTGDNGTVMHGVNLEFTYTVNGQKFVSPSSSPYRSSSPKSTQQKAETYAMGARHPIRYDPNDPGEMRFDVGYNPGFFFVPLLLGSMGLVFGLVGFFLLRTRADLPATCPSCGQPFSDRHSFCPICPVPLSDSERRAA